MFRTAFAITPSDTVALTRPCQSFTVGVAGNVSVLTAAGETVVIPVIAGFVYPLLVNRVNATGTTATGVVGFQG